MYVVYCKQCGFWRVEEQWIDDFGGPGESKGTWITGLVKEYDLSDKMAPIEALRRFLRQHPDHVAYTHATAFEKLMAECLPHPPELPSHKRTDPPFTPAGKNKIERVTSQPSDKLPLTIDDLEDRSAMLEDVRAKISFLKRDLAALLLSDAFGHP